MYNVPTINTDRMTWLWMNATSDAVLQDIQGYYLVNASDSMRLNLTLANDWWNLTESIRKDVFRDVWELEDGWNKLYD